MAEEREQKRTADTMTSPELAAHRRPRFGTVVDGLQFTARRPTWSAEWGALAHGWWHTARLAGTHLGPLGEAVYDRVKQGLSALDTAKEWCVIHGDLHPSNFLFARPASNISRRCRCS